MYSINTVGWVTKHFWFFNLLTFNQKTYNGSVSSFLRSVSLCPSYYNLCAHTSCRDSSSSLSVYVLRSRSVCHGLNQWLLISWHSTKLHLKTLCLPSPKLSLPVTRSWCIKWTYIKWPEDKHVGFVFTWSFLCRLFCLFI